MKIPKSVKVGGRDYSILFPHTFTDSSRTLYGQHDPAGQTIKIAEKDEFGCVRHDQSVAHTFLHELLHAIDNVYNGGRVNGWEKGEETIDQLADGLMQVFADNDLECVMTKKKKDKKKGGCK